MLKTITYCDINKTENAQNFRIENGLLDNGGPDRETDWYTIDLGHGAAMQTLRYIEEKVLMQVQREALISYLEKIRKS